jgi:hypothetical protein
MQHQTQIKKPAFVTVSDYYSVGRLVGKSHVKRA